LTSPVPEFFDQNQNVHFDLRVPPDLEGGVYANFLGVWHTAHEFTLDFSATLPAEPTQMTEMGAVMHVPCRVTARVKVPPTLVFDIIRALNENLTGYEEKFGAIRRPGGEEPLFIPDEELPGD